MRKIFLSIVSAVVLATSCGLPSYADTEGVLKYPVAMASFLAGTVIGTPIAVVRKTVDNTKETKEKVTDSENPVVCAGACLVALPVGMLTGTLEGLWLGPKNAATTATEDPFSKDAFSMGDLD